MKNRSIIGLAFLAVVFVSACSKDPEQVVPAELSEYVEAFFSEGERRGLGYGLNDIELRLEFGELSGTIGGQCSIGSNTVLIDRVKWETYNEPMKKWLVFHELGHCVLRRRHANTMAPNGECYSFMKGAENGFECSLNLYSERWWTYYLDELFGAPAVLPDWYSLKVGYDGHLFEDTLLSKKIRSKKLRVDSLGLANEESFNVDLLFKQSLTRQRFVKFNMGNIGFGYCDVCSGTNVSISSDQDGYTFFENFKGELRSNSDSKLSIRKLGNRLIFYLNEKHLHTMENNLWRGEELYTITMADSLEMELMVLK